MFLVRAAAKLFSSFKGPRLGLFYFGVMIMGIMNFFSHAAEKQLAVQMVERLVRDLPPSLIELKTAKMSVNRVTRLLERTYQTAMDHQQDNRMGFVKRAVLANAFKWGLTERGYPQSFVDVAVEGLVMALAKKRA